MIHTEERNIIEATLKHGDKTPGLSDFPKILSVKSKLEECTCIYEDVGLMENYRGLISNSFGITDVAFNGSVGKIKALKSTASENNASNASTAPLKAPRWTIHELNDFVSTLINALMNLSRVLPE